MQPDPNGHAANPHKPAPERGDITLLIERAHQGRPEAQEKLLGEVYNELRTIAASYMKHERANHTLGATALVNESYIKMFAGNIDAPKMSYAHRHAFFKAASVAMRRILIDHARARAASKRSPQTGRMIINADLEIASEEANPHDLIALDEAINQFELEDERAATVVQLRFYAGRQNSEIAEMMGVSERTVKRDWEFARARLQQLLDIHSDSDETES